jgi:hypothetical protein
VQTLGQGSVAKVAGGNGNDTINVGNASTLDTIQGAICADGGAGTNTVNVNDQNDTDANTYSFTGSTVERTGSFMLTFANTAALNLNAGKGNDTINVNALTAALAVTVNAGGGTDLLHFQPGTFTSVTHTFTNAQSGTVAQETAQLTYTALESIRDEMTADDRAFNFNNNAQTITLQNDINQPNGQINGVSQISSPGQALTVFFYNPSHSLTVNGGSGNDTINVFSTIDANFATLTTNIYSGAGNDEVRVLRTVAGLTLMVDTGVGVTDRTVIGAASFAVFNTNTGNINSILGKVLVEDNGGDGGQLYIDDSGNRTARRWEFTAMGAIPAQEIMIDVTNGVTNGTTFGDICYRAGINQLMFAAGAGSDNITIGATLLGSSTFCGNNGNDRVTINGDHLQGNVAVYGGDGVDTFRLNVTSRIGSDILLLDWITTTKTAAARVRAAAVRAAAPPKVKAARPAPFRTLGPLLTSVQHG